MQLKQRWPGSKESEANEMYKRILDVANGIGLKQKHDNCLLKETNSETLKLITFVPQTRYISLNRNRSSTKKNN